MTHPSELNSLRQLPLDQTHLNCKTYLNSVCKAPAMGRPEFVKQMAIVVAGRNMPEDSPEYARAIVAKNRIVAGNMRFVADKCLTTYRQLMADRQIPLEELCQLGAIGLAKAVDRFNPTRKVNFTSFCWLFVKGEICQYLAWGADTIRLPFHTKREFLTVFKAIKQAELRGEPTGVDSIAIVLDMPVKKVARLIKAGAEQNVSLIGLDCSIGENHFKQHRKRQFAIANSSQQPATDTVQMFSDELLKQLEQIERDVIERQFGLFGEKQSGIAIDEELGLEPGSARRHKRVALKKLKGFLEGHDIDFQKVRAIL